MEGNQKIPASSSLPQKNPYPTKTYKDLHHIRYLEDVLKHTSNINFRKLDLQNFDEKAVAINEYDSLYEKLYKKFTRDGYLRKKDEIAKKSKKKNQCDLNFYNTSDPFIDDEDQGQEKAFSQPIYDEFVSFTGSFEEFYKSSYYLQNTQSAKRPLEKPSEEM